MSDMEWDGRVMSYRPSTDWRERVSSALPLSVDWATEIDPVTYEVIRNRLWTINIAHGETLTRISGSPVFQTLDFNMCITTEDAENVMNAPYLQYLNGGGGYAIRYIMEHYSDEPGIFEDDVFIGNDPWISATHQMDIQISAPVFVDGKLFAWISSAGHQYDLGGISPGGWPQGSPNVYSDPVVLPHFKFVERGVIRKDLERLYLRQSRTADFVSLDLRAGLIGATQARSAVQDLCRQFGAPVVKGVMKGILDQGQRAMQEKLSRIPDGTWSEAKYSGEALPGDRNVYRIQVNISKKGDRLTVDNHGTDPQVANGPMGITFVAFAGAVTSTIALNMLYTQLFAVGGAERQIDFDVDPGRLNSVNYPAAVSGGVGNIITNMFALQACVARMLACDPELSDDILAPDPDHPLVIVAGTNDRGDPFGQALLDCFGGGRGARSTADGVNTGGPSASPLSRLLNVESVEQWYPLLYLYRHENSDTGGAGTWRGGNGLTMAVTPYRAQEAVFEFNACGLPVTAANGQGVFGGYPAPGVAVWHAVETDLDEHLAAGRMPTSVTELAAQRRTRLPGKLNSTPFGSHDVLEVGIGGGGGFGDPLLREPSAVVRDIADRYTSREFAMEIYGVVLDASGQLDETATATQRDDLRNGRRSWRLLGEDTAAVTRTADADGGGTRQVHVGIDLGDRGSERMYICRSCGHAIANAASDFKLGLRMHEGPITAITGAVDPAESLEQTIVFRRFCCPECLAMLTTEVAREGDPVVCEMLLD
jgi:N-methylhydantoinase B